MNKAGRIIRQRSSEGDETKTKSKRESREASVRKMEELQLKHSSLKQDLQRLLDEKEDMVKEKEDMNIKVNILPTDCNPCLLYVDYSLLA